ncbi:GFA family protein [Myxococcus sp. K15C18031901]|uniref:GFA family protein n=1 Tax=Myxococcus dinghuensis TaxID=2906761 RepID=UPI0020A80EDE|nr:GFA family protein [Myxococcus dinghuensis]MCP3098034.1 GFA family protein [Myxococcus dinghuensis]
MSETSSLFSPNLKKHVGGCHCGAVRFECEVDLSQPLNRCNCTVCTKMGGTTTQVPPKTLRVISGEAHLGDYRVGASVNYRKFCQRCGVQCFGGGYVEVLGGDFATINVGCLDGVDLALLSIQYWDGRNDNWEAGSRPQPWPLQRA